MRAAALPTIAAVIFAAAWWLSRGVLAVAGPSPTSSRVGLLPPFWLLGVLVAIFALAALTRSFRRIAPPLAAAIVVLLPWLPGSIPSAFIIWTGPAAVAVLVLLLAGAVAVAIESGIIRLPAAIGSPRRAPFIAATMAAMCFGAAAWQLAHILPDGDEPHYLVIAQSLLYDGDLQIENNHVRGDYHAYFANALKPDYLRRGTNGAIYSIHAPGLPAIVAPAFALAGYPGVIAFLVITSALATGLAWTVAYRVTASKDAAWFGWAAVTFAAPFFFHAFTVYPDGLGAALVLTGVHGLTREKMAPRALLLHGTALAMLPWLHTRYALLAAILGVAIVGRLLGTEGAVSDGRTSRADARSAMLRRRVIPAVSFAVVPIFSAAAWLAYFYILYGQWSPTAPYGHYTQTSLAFVPTGFLGLLFDQQFGLVANAPVIGLAAIGFAAAFGGRSAERTGPWLALSLLVLVIPYLAAAGAYRMWWGGSSAPARFAAPIVLALVVPLARAWQAGSRATRACAVGALLVSVGITYALAFLENGFLLYNQRDGAALWLKWISPSTDLAAAAPSYIRQDWIRAAGITAVWLACAAIGWTLLIVLRRLHSTASLALWTAVAMMAAVMTAAAVVWALEDAQSIRVAPAQTRLLNQYDPVMRPYGVTYRPLRLSPAGAVPPVLLIPTSERPPGVRGPAPLFFTASAPAGRYRVEAGGRAEGTVVVRAGRSISPIYRVVLGGPAPPEFVLPVDVAGIVIDSDSGDSSGLRTLWLQPVSVIPPRERLIEGRAWQSGRYGPAAVFALDHRTFFEPPGIWTRGGVDTWIVVHPDEPGPFRLFLRNGPVSNQVDLAATGWQHAASMRPGEELEVVVPQPGRAAATLLHIRTSSGFRPHDVDPTTADVRYLGVWMEIR